MKKTVERIEGDTEGVAYEFPVFRFEGSDEAAPRAYLQAALHAGELPGTVAVDALMPLLARAEAEGRIRGALTIVPWANPIGRAQYQFGDHLGRFHAGTRVNFNRDFPLVDRPDPALLPDGTGATVDRKLKARLLSLSLGHDIVLDLHCDDESLPYLYVPAELWPAMQDCAAAMDVAAVLLWQGESGGAFEEASVHPHLASGGPLERIVVTTVEYRGVADVDRATAESDARGLYRLLVARGVVDDPSLPKPGPFTGVVSPLENIDMMPAPQAGAVLYDVRPGDRVKKGDRLAAIVYRPGEPGGHAEVFAPQDGLILTRRSHRVTRAGDDLVKLLGARRSGDARAGTLED